MMKPFTLAHLQSIAREIIGDRDLVLRPEQSAPDVPGWDSLNHTLISVEIESGAGVDVSSEELAAQPDFGALVELVRSRQG